MRGCWGGGGAWGGAWLRGGHVWLPGGHAWLLGGMRGCRGACIVAEGGGVGACMVAAGGGAVKLLLYIFLITSYLYAKIANLGFGKEMYFEVGCCTFTLCNTKFTSIFYIITKKNNKQTTQTI